MKPYHQIKSTIPLPREQKIMPGLETGGPAFPSSMVHHYTTVVSGMTLLDYFAGQALMGELAAQSEISGFYNHDKPNQPADLARRCYVFAQAMLVERSRLEQESQKGVAKDRWLHG